MSALYMTLPAFAAERRYPQHGARCYRANPLHGGAAVDRWDRHADGRTDTRPLRRACFAYYAGNVNKKKTAAGQDYLSIRGICVARLKC